VRTKVKAPKKPAKVQKKRPLGRPVRRTLRTVSSTKNAKVETSRRLKKVELKKSAIIEAALQTFSRNGLHGTTLDQIAEAADVSKTNLFYYFATKEDIYVAVLRQLLSEWLAPLQALESDGDPAESIRNYIRMKIELSRDNPASSRLFCLEIIQGAPLIGGVLRSSMKELVDAKTAVINGWIAAGKLAPVDPYHLIFSIWATTQHYADFAVQVDAVLGRTLSEDAFLEDTVQNVQRIILDGIRPR
jgi:TetR/AcrR family transcriptional regulator